MEEKIKLSPPWEEYARKITILFGQDEDIDVELKDMELIIRVDSTDKVEALTGLLPAEKKFGNVSLPIKIIPANTAKKTKRDYIKDLFKGNYAVSRIKDFSLGSNDMLFIEFDKEVIQYYDDNLGDLHGNRTTVMEQIAREVFENINGVSFCTDNVALYEE